MRYSPIFTDNSNGLAIRRHFGGTHTSRIFRARRTVSDFSNFPLRRHTEFRFRDFVRFSARSFPFVDGEFRISRSRSFLFQRRFPSRGLLSGNATALIGVREIPVFRRSFFPRFRKILRLPLGGGLPHILRLPRFGVVFLSSDVVRMRARRVFEKAFRRRGALALSVPRKRVRFHSPRFPFSRDDCPFQSGARSFFGPPLFLFDFID